MKKANSESTRSEVQGFAIDERFVVMMQLKPTHWEMFDHSTTERVVLALKYEVIDRGRNYRHGEKSLDRVVGRFVNRTTAQDFINYLTTILTDEIENEGKVFELPLASR